MTPAIPSTSKQSAKPPAATPPKPPQPLHAAWVLLLSPLLPFYTLPRASKTPLHLAIPFALAAVPLFIPLLTLIWNPNEYNTFSKAIDTFQKMCVWYFSPSPAPLFIPPIFLITAMLLAVLLLLGLILLPRVASPHQTMWQAYPAALKRLSLITPTLFLMAIPFLLCIAMPEIIKNHTINQRVAAFEQANPRPRFNGKQPQQMTEAEKQWSKQHFEIYFRPHWNISKTTNTYAIPLATLIFISTPLMFRFYARKFPSPAGNRSKWPATCEACGYHIFSPNNKKHHHHSQACPECGLPITKSIQPDHRIDDLCTRAPFAIKRLHYVFPLTFQLLFKPKTLADQLRTHNANPAHHQTARLALTLIIPLTCLCAFLVSTASNKFDFEFPYHIDFGFSPTLYNEFYFNFAIAAAIVLVATYILIQLLAFLNAAYISLLLRKPNPFFAMKLANLSAGALLLITFASFLSFFLFHKTLPYLPAHFFNTLPDAFQSSEVLAYFLPFAVGAFLLLAWLIPVNFYIMQRCRHANV